MSDEMFQEAGVPYQNKIIENVTTYNQVTGQDWIRGRFVESILSEYNANPQTFKSIRLSEEKPVIKPNNKKASSQKSTVPTTETTTTTTPPPTQTPTQQTTTPPPTQQTQPTQTTTPVSQPTEEETDTTTPTQETVQAQTTTTTTAPVTDVLTTPAVVTNSQEMNALANTLTEDTQQNTTTYDVDSKTNDCII